MNEDHPISTQDLQTATNYLDEFVQAIREAHNGGVDLGVEHLTLLMFKAFHISGAEYRVIAAQQALMLSIAIQRLAA